ncbi:hypothetical protein [Flagellimonas onchidii]|uniref:hypothetical protein n=1 Tax=Flagellimonas onchidii TaxID=2562684 RepID=UPI0010A5A965|nr:hypothetical protein [Allomuricauda onchidii]
MKKLSLKKLKLSKDDLVQKEQLKTVFGGYNGQNENNPNCYDACFSDAECSIFTSCRPVIVFGCNWEYCRCV